MSDELERLSNIYRLRATAPAKSRIDALLDFVRIRDSRVVPFLLYVLEDQRESQEVRVHVVKQLRRGGGLLAPTDAPPVAEALGDVLADASSEELRLQAALALGDFTQVPGVLSKLMAVAVAREESIDLRYAAFTSIERAGPTAESIAELQQLTLDETLGGAARSVLSAWHVD